MYKSIFLIATFFCVNGFAMSAGETAGNLGFSAAPPGYTVPQSPHLEKRRVSCALLRNRFQIPGLNSELHLQIPAGVTRGSLGIDETTGYAFNFDEGSQTVRVRTSTGQVAVYSCRGF